MASYIDVVTKKLNLTKISDYNTIQDFDRITRRVFMVGTKTDGKWIFGNIRIEPISEKEAAEITDIVNPKRAFWLKKQNRKIALVLFTGRGSKITRKFVLPKMGVNIEKFLKEAL